MEIFNIEVSNKTIHELWNIKIVKINGITVLTGIDNYEVRNTMNYIKDNTIGKYRHYQIYPSFGYYNNTIEPLRAHTYTEIPDGKKEIVSLICPESGMHLSNYRHIVELLYNKINNNYLFLVETYSQEFINEIRIMVKRDLIPCDRVAFYNIDENGVIEEVTIQPNGKLVYWPKNFFDTLMRQSAILAREE